MNKFNELNREALPIFNGPGEAARAWIEQYKLMQEQTKELDYTKSKLALYELLVKRKSYVETSYLAELFGINTFTLNKFLEDKGIKFKNEDYPTPDYEDWFKIIGDVAPSGHDYDQVLISPLGVTEITKLWNSYLNNRMGLQG